MSTTTIVYGTDWLTGIVLDDATTWGEMVRIATAHDEAGRHDYATAVRREMDDRIHPPVQRSRRAPSRRSSTPTLRTGPRSRPAGQF